MCLRYLMLTNCKICPPLCLYITLFNKKNRSNAKLPGQSLLLNLNILYTSAVTFLIYIYNVCLIPGGDREFISD